MKKQYNIPVLEWILIASTDVLTASQDDDPFKEDVFSIR